MNRVEASTFGRDIPEEEGPRASRAQARPRHRERPRRAPRVEALEERSLLSTFTVSNRQGSGAGSLRWAISRANANPGADTIAFGVSGTTLVGGRSLPAIRDAVTIDGTSAPGYAGAPTVTVNFQGASGLDFAAGSAGSKLEGLALVRAGGAGVTLNASRITVAGNSIGLAADGRGNSGNAGDGIRINASSRGNIIGNSDSVSGIRYFGTAGVSTQPVTYWQGIRDGDLPDQSIIAGTSDTLGLLYIGPISGNNGRSYTFNYPGAVSTSAYGPDNLGDGRLRIVGSYKLNNTGHAFLYEGTVDEFGVASNYRTINYPNSTFNFAHSTMGGLVVGNADGPEGNLPLGTGHAYLYDVASNTFRTDIVYPGSTSTTAYGIWHNGGTRYTIAGGYSTALDPASALGHGFLVDYDAATDTYSNWASFDDPKRAPGRGFVTHFEGISGGEKGVYTLVADSVQVGSASLVQGSFVTVRRNADGSFGPSTWVDLDAPTTGGPVTANSVAGNRVVGITLGSGSVAFQATIDMGFQLSNVIATNGGNGIGIYGSSDNIIAMNFIGTDPTGTLKRGNGGSGILVTKGASRNLIGGQATGGNNPTGGTRGTPTFVRPPQGNLISGNKADGVRITAGASRNILSGNFVGTTASGNAALGNAGDGVAIVNADDNGLIGCTFQQDPFVFYNVVSGNGGNGLRVTDSDNVTVHANFLGIGADNATVVSNRGNGLLVSGTSRNTQVGGVIPLGNVISGNARNGIEVADRASGFVSFNTFGGIFAFGQAAPNGEDGIHITSTGGNNQIRTSIISGNLGDGIEIGGDATGVQVTETAVGTDTNIGAGIPNAGTGIRISGRAHGNLIGGFQPSIEPQATISANFGYGIAVVDRARDNRIIHTYIGTNHSGDQPLGNTLGGIYLGSGTSGTSIGGPTSALGVLVRSNGGDGILIRSARRTTIASSAIAQNRAFGLRASGRLMGTVVRGTPIVANGSGNVNLTGATGITILP